MVIAVALVVGSDDVVRVALKPAEAAERLFGEGLAADRAAPDEPQPQQEQPAIALTVDFSTLAALVAQPSQFSLQHLVEACNTICDSALPRPPLDSLSGTAPALDQTRPLISLDVIGWYQGDLWCQPPSSQLPAAHAISLSGSLAFLLVREPAVDSAASFKRHTLLAACFAFLAGLYAEVQQAVSTPVGGADVLQALVRNLKALGKVALQEDCSTAAPGQWTAAKAAAFLCQAVSALLSKATENQLTGLADIALLALLLKLVDREPEPHEEEGPDLPGSAAQLLLALLAREMELQVVQLTSASHLLLRMHAHALLLQLPAKLFSDFDKQLADTQALALWVAGTILDTQLPFEVAFFDAVAMHCGFDRIMVALRRYLRDGSLPGAHVYLRMHCFRGGAIAIFTAIARALPTLYTSHLVPHVPVLLEALAAVRCSDIAAVYAADSLRLIATNYQQAAEAMTSPDAIETLLCALEQRPACRQQTSVTSVIVLLVNRCTRAIKVLQKRDCFARLTAAAQEADECWQTQSALLDVLGMLGRRESSLPPAPGEPYELIAVRKSVELALQQLPKAMMQDEDEYGHTLSIISAIEGLLPHTQEGVMHVVKSGVAARIIVLFNTEAPTCHKMAAACIPALARLIELHYSVLSAFVKSHCMAVVASLLVGGPVPANARQPGGVDARGHAVAAVRLPASTPQAKLLWLVDRCFLGTANRPDDRQALLDELHATRMLEAVATAILAAAHDGYTMALEDWLGQALRTAGLLMEIMYTKEELQDGQAALLGILVDAATLWLQHIATVLQTFNTLQPAITPVRAGHVDNALKHLVALIARLEKDQLLPRGPALEQLAGVLSGTYFTPSRQGQGRFLVPAFEALREPSMAKCVNAMRQLLRTLPAAGAGQAAPGVAPAPGNSLAELLDSAAQADANMAALLDEESQKAAAAARLKAKKKAKKKKGKAAPEAVVEGSGAPSQEPAPATAAPEVPQTPVDQLPPAEQPAHDADAPEYASAGPCSADEAAGSSSCAAAQPVPQAQGSMPAAPEACAGDAVASGPGSDASCQENGVSGRDSASSSGATADFAGWSQPQDKQLAACQPAASPATAGAALAPPAKAGAGQAAARVSQAVWPVPKPHASRAEPALRSADDGGSSRAAPPPTPDPAQPTQAEQPLASGPASSLSAAAKPFALPAGPAAAPEGKAQPGASASQPPAIRLSDAPFARAERAADAPARASQAQPASGRPSQAPLPAGRQHAAPRAGEAPAGRSPASAGTLFARALAEAQPPSPAAPAPPPAAERAAARSPSAAPPPPAHPAQASPVPALTQQPPPGAESLALPAAGEPAATPLTVAQQLAQWAAGRVASQKQQRAAALAAHKAKVAAARAEAAAASRGAPDAPGSSPKPPAAVAEDGSGQPPGSQLQRRSSSGTPPPASPQAAPHAQPAASSTEAPALPVNSPAVRASSPAELGSCTAQSPAIRGQAPAPAAAQQSAARYQPPAALGVPPGWPAPQLAAVAAPAAAGVQGMQDTWPPSQQSAVYPVATQNGWGHAVPGCSHDSAPAVAAPPAASQAASDHVLPTPLNTRPAPGARPAYRPPAIPPVPASSLPPPSGPLRPLQPPPGHPHHIPAASQAPPVLPPFQPQPGAIMRAPRPYTPPTKPGAGGKEAGDDLDELDGLLQLLTSQQPPEQPRTPPLAQLPRPPVALSVPARPSQPPPASSAPLAAPLRTLGTLGATSPAPSRAVAQHAQLPAFKFGSFAEEALLAGAAKAHSGGTAGQHASSAQRPSQQQQDAAAGAARLVDSQRQAAGLQPPAAKPAPPVPGAPLPQKVPPALQQLLAAGTAGDGGPNSAMTDNFCCPITHELMSDPVICADGFTYERSAIEAWLAKHATSPLTNLPLAHTLLIPNHVVRSAVALLLQNGTA